MYDIKQYGVPIQCPISHREETVFFHEVSVDGKYCLRFDGCDHQFSDCEECKTCHKLAYEKLIDSNRSTPSNATSSV